jgi:predicted lipoprotein
MLRRRLAACFVALAACGDDGTSDGTDTDGVRIDAPDDGLNRTQLLTHLGTDIFLPMYTELETTTAALSTTVTAYCTALDSGTVGTTHDDAKAAWRAAMDDWQAIDAVLVGPAAMDGKILRDRAYAWPLVSPCGINRDTASRWADPSTYDVTAQPVNERSLAGLEFLLFTTETAHGCPVTPPSWDAMAADLPRARCRIAEALAQDVATTAQTLATAWSPAGGDFAGQLGRAGQSGSEFPTEQAALNAISDGFFYADRFIKDMKLAQPAGIVDNACATVQEPCLREVEHLESDHGTFAIRINLAALKAVFTGGEGLGFDDLLRAAGANELADRMTTNFDAAIAAAAAIDDSFVSALSSDYTDVVAAHAALRAITDDLKTQFLTVLALEIPDDVATDND